MRSAFAAIAMHGVYNQFVLPPVVSTLILLAVLPPLVLLTFDRSERSLMTGPTATPARRRAAGRPSPTESSSR